MPSITRYSKNIVDGQTDGRRMTDKCSATFPWYHKIILFIVQYNTGFKRSTRIRILTYVCVHFLQNGRHRKNIALPPYPENVSFSDVFAV